MKVQSVSVGVTSPIPFEVLLEKMLPHFRYYAKNVLKLKGNSDNFDDAIQELSAIAYEMYLSLVRRGKEVFYTPIKNFTIQRYQDGRRFIGSNTTDMLSERTKCKGRSEVCSLSQLDENDAMLFYMVDQQSELFDRVQFRIDFFEGVVSTAITAGSKDYPLACNRGKSQ